MYTSFADDLLKKRYLKDNEDIHGMFDRVATHISQAEKENTGQWRDKFFNLMNDLDFLPNSPCLMNAGTSMPQLAACFVYPIEDDLESIFDTLKLSALTHKSGGGTGFSFSRLRPRGDSVGKTGGITSGPVSFMEVYDKATDAIRQGGKRRGANMSILRVDHPDIEEFIDSKLEDDKLNNFNISVAVSDKFMESVKNDSDFYTTFPPDGEKRKKMNPKNILEKIARGAWKTGEPGVIFIDKINRGNPIPALGMIEATNPCGEMPLLPYEACILGSINLSKHVKEGAIDWDKLGFTTGMSVRFLDDAIDVSEFPLKEIKDLVLKNRKIGLGVMGFASMLVEIGIPYNSIDAIRIGKKIMKFINQKAHKASEELAVEKGEFPNFSISDLSVKRRNALVTTIAPTGSISIIAGASSGIEPIYSPVIERQNEDGKIYRIVDPVLMEKIKDLNIPQEKIINDITEHGKISSLDYIPSKVRELFLSAMEIDPRIHVLMQAAFQKNVDNAISKTVNLPEDFPLDDVKDIIITSYRVGCKGITLYRQHSREQQVLNIVCECDR